MQGNYKFTWCDNNNILNDQTRSFSYPLQCAMRQTECIFVAILCEYRQLQSVALTPDVVIVIALSNLKKSLITETNSCYLRIFFRSCRYCRRFVYIYYILANEISTFTKTFAYLHIRSFSPFRLFSTLTLPYHTVAFFYLFHKHWC